MDHTATPDALARAAAQATECENERRRLRAAATDPMWHLVQCLGRSDSYALETFKRYEIETYYPKILELKIVPRRSMSRAQRMSGIEVRRPVSTPLFPRYIFMRADQRDPRVRTVFEVAGVGGLVCRNGAPLCVPDEAISHIKSRENGDGVVPGKESMRAVFKIGDEVRVTNGPFASFPAVVERGLDVAIEEFDPETRIKVAVSLFGRATPVELEIWQVAKAD